MRTFIVALGGAFALLAFSSGTPATPVLAASALTGQPVATIHVNPSTAQLLTATMASQGTTYTPDQLAGATAYLTAHPMQGTIQGIGQPTAPSTGPKVNPDLSVGVYWWGVRIHLTNGDVTSLFSAIVTYGAAAVAAALCAPGVWLSVACGLLGAIVGWIVVTVVLQATHNFGGCALNIDISWNLNWHFYCTY
jgi:hypothetical protein